MTTQDNRILKRIFISTGEVSGDLQGALLIAALYRQAEKLGLELEITALGGDRMAQAGAKLLANTSAIGSMGLVEALPFVLPTLQIQRIAKRHLQENPPDLVLLIDYMGPNLGLGTYLKQHLPQIPVVYYIAPQLWVWSLQRQDTKTVVKICDKLLAVFPAEAKYYEKHGANVSWVGHPLVDRMPTVASRSVAREQLGIGDTETAIALLPASRPQELKYLMPVMFQAAQRIQAQIPTAQFWIPLSLEEYRPVIEQAIEQYQLRAKIVTTGSQEVLAAADLAITKSGTVNLELALLNVPQVVIYRISAVTNWIGRKLVGFSIPFMSPVNLLVMRGIVPELFQENATAEAIIQESLDLLLNPQRRAQIQADYQEMRQTMGDVGVCDRAALEILEMI